jgi:Spy/CpxP family protein refolding chaperone
MTPRNSRNDILPLIALCAAFLLFLAVGESRAAEAAIEGFFGPELIVKYHEQIGLTEDQGASLKSVFEDAQQRVQGLQQQMQQESKKLVELAKPEKVDEKAVVTQADKILDVEREIKHAQLSLLIAIKNTLTASQQAKLKELSPAASASAAGLETKVNQVKAAVQRWQQEGRDLSQFSNLKGEIESLMAAGKIAEVNDALDRALKVLNGPEAK